MNIKEMLLPGKTYNKFIDNDIRSEGRLEWLERVLQEGQAPTPHKRYRTS